MRQRPWSRLTGWALGTGRVRACTASRQVVQAGRQETVGLVGRHRHVYAVPDEGVEGKQCAKNARTWLAPTARTASSSV